MPGSPSVTLRTWSPGSKVMNRGCAFLQKPYKSCHEESRKLRLLRVPSLLVSNPRRGGKLVGRCSAVERHPEAKHGRCPTVRTSNSQERSDTVTRSLNRLAQLPNPHRQVGVRTPRYWMLDLAQHFPSSVQAVNSHRSFSSHLFRIVPSTSLSLSLWQGRAELTL
jgi:hypothetical protein